MRRTDTGPGQRPGPGPGLGLGPGPGPEPGREPEPGPGREPEPTTPAGRLRALGRGEFALLGRSWTSVATALLLPPAFTVAMKPTIDGLDLAGAGLTPGTALLPAAIGFVLLFGVYCTLVPAYVVRREERVLKRLRAGEPGDAEILAGTALPAVAVAFGQCVLLGLAGSLALRVPAPKAPYLVAAGVLLGTVMLVALAAATAAGTRTAESAQLTIAPLMTVTLVGSGLVVPLELLPAPMAAPARLLPLSPVTTLVRTGWTGEIHAASLAGALLTGLAWTAVSVFAVRRWFRWEPRR